MLKMQVVGHLGNDASVQTVNGRNVINFSVAHSEKYKNAQGEMENRTVWVSCSWWTDRLNIVPYLKKGVQVLAEGLPLVKTYQNQQGVTIAQQALTVREIHLLSSSKSGSSETSAADSGNVSGSWQSSHTAQPDGAPDDLPF